MKKKQKVLTIISGDGKFIAPNRATARKMKATGVEFFRVKQTPKTDTKKSEFKQFRKDLAKEHGSKTGELKKKHLAREKGWKVRGERNE